MEKKKYKFESITWTFLKLDKKPDVVVYITAKNKDEADRKLKSIMNNHRVWTCCGYVENWWEK